MHLAGCLRDGSGRGASRSRSCTATPGAPSASPCPARPKASTARKVGAGLLPHSLHRPGVTSQGQAGVRTPVLFPLPHWVTRWLLCELVFSSVQWGSEQRWGINISELSTAQQACSRKSLRTSGVTPWIVKQRAACPWMAALHLYTSSCLGDPHKESPDAKGPV